MLKIAIITSLIVHTISLWWIPSQQETKTTNMKDLKIKIVTPASTPIPTPAPTSVPTPKPTPIVQKPKPMPPPKKPKKIIRKKKKVPTRRKPKKKPVKNAKVIQGLTKNSLAPKDSQSKKQIAAPIGNTMMIPDTGERLDPDKVQELEQNLSLIHISEPTRPY